LVIDRKYFDFLQIPLVSSAVSVYD